MAREYRVTERIKLFCHEYAIDFNGRRSALAVGVSEKSATQQASMWLASVGVREFLATLTKEKNDILKVTADRVLTELARLAFHDVGSYYKRVNGKETLKSLEELSADQRAAIIEYDPKLKTMKLSAKDGPLEKLGKHLKLFTELHEQQHTFTIMPELKLNGKTMIFNVGEPRKK